MSSITQSAVEEAARATTLLATTQQQQQQQQVLQGHLLSTLVTGMRRPGRAIKQIKNPDDKIGDESNPPRPTTPPRPGTRKTFAPSFAFHVSPVTGIGHDRTPAVVPRPPLSAHEVSPRRRLSQDFRVEARIRDNNNNNNNNTSQGTPRSRVYRSPLPPPPLFLRTDLTIVVLSLSARTPTEFGCTYERG